MKLVLILLVLQFILLTSGVFRDEDNSVTDDAIRCNSTNKDVKANDELSLRKQISVFCPPCGIAVQKYDCCCLHRAGRLNRCSRDKYPKKNNLGYCCYYSQDMIRDDIFRKSNGQLKF